MSNMKNGFSTLNRWLGKKNKDKAAVPNGKLSKSSTNLNHPLSISISNINETSQLEYNRITPLPAATSNAPFEQTFRITVLLPKDQLYVTRLGARVPLSKLLELVCENKLLDADKFEFRNPVDPSQVYGTDLTIGSVGLSEIRLCNKSESYDNFNTDEVIKSLHRTAVIRDSLSSSEFSSRNSKHTMKTASPYSSNNSLNSMDSTGMNYTRTPVAVPQTLSSTTAATQQSVNETQQKLAVPPRKKRAAPRPPSQSVIPEKSPLVITNIEESEKTIQMLKESNGNVSLPRKNYYESTPNLSEPIHFDNNIEYNGNATINHNGNANIKNTNNNSPDITLLNNGHHAEPIYAEVAEKNARNRYSGSEQNLSIISAESQKFPEPSPRKRLIQIKKKSAPAPPPRNGCGSIYSEDSESLASFTISTPGTPGTPVTPTTPIPTLITTNMNKSFTSETTAVLQDARRSPITSTREATTTVETAPAVVNNTVAPVASQPSTPVVDSRIETVTVAQTVKESPNETVVPKPIPRVTTVTSLNSSTSVETNAAVNVPATTEKISNNSIITAQQTTTTTTSNVSKVLLNRTPTPEPRSLSSEPPEVELSELRLVTGDHCNTDDDNISKQADSGIGEPVPSPIPDSLPSEGSTHECKSTFESSSDDDETVKVYNFKLGKTVVKPCHAHNSSIEENKKIVTSPVEGSCGEMTPSSRTQENTPAVSETSSWNFSIPISPPPNFADGKFDVGSSRAEKIPDSPITPKIKARPVLNFDTFVKPTAAAVSPSSPSSVDQTDRAAVAVKQIPKFKPATPTFIPSNATTPTTPMNEIVDELATIIHAKGINTLIKKADNPEEIKSAKPNTLTNFSIASAVSQQDKKDNQEQLAKKTSFEPAAFDEEKIYRKHGAKNSVSHQQQQRRSVTRADSFHTTALPTTDQTSPKLQNSTEIIQNGLSSRSSSHLSLTKLEQNGLNLNRRRSSSELSIGESPSLQSLEVIKTILNSRKNSLANSSSDGETGSKTEIPAAIVNNIERQTYKSPTEIQPKSTTTTLTTDLKIKTEVKTETPSPQPVVIEEQKPKELPKVYRYSGPPSINFSTWNERPKAQVSIKNEGDYIFGGKNAGSANAAVTTAKVKINTQSYRSTMPPGSLKMVEDNIPPPAVVPKPASPIERMGIPDKEYHVPITVKPLRDITIENVELRAHKTPNGVEKPENNRQTESVVIRRPLTQASNTSTLPRTNTNRFSTPAAQGPQLFRATSITKLEQDNNKPKTTTSVEIVTETPACPFGQNTLRKTGLKEKILAKEEEKRELAVKLGSNNVRAVSTPTPPVSSSTIQKPATTKIIQNGSVTVTTGGATTDNNSTVSSANTKTLQSAKLEMKLQSSPNVFVVNKQNHYQTSTVKTTTTTKTNTSTAIRASSSTPPPPPAPPASIPMLLKSVSLKSTASSSSSRTTTPTSADDPRDQLLDSIRNFNRDGLRRS